MSVKYHLGLERKMAKVEMDICRFKPSRSARHDQKKAYNEAMQYFLQAAYGFMYKHHDLIASELDTFQVGLNHWMESLGECLSDIYPLKVSVNMGVIDTLQYAESILKALKNFSDELIYREIYPPSILLFWKTKRIERSLSLSIFHMRLANGITGKDPRRHDITENIKRKTATEYLDGTMWKDSHIRHFFQDMIEANLIPVHEYSFEQEGTFDQNLNCIIQRKFRSVFIENVHEGEDRFSFFKESMDLSTVSTYLTGFLIYAHGQRHQLTENDVNKLNVAVQDYLTLSLKAGDTSVLLALMNEPRYFDWVTPLLLSRSEYIQNMDASKRNQLSHQLFKSVFDWLLAEGYRNVSKEYRDGIDSYLKAMIPLLNMDPMEVIQLDRVQSHIEKHPSEHLTRLSSLLESLSLQIQINTNGDSAQEKPAYDAGSFIL